MEDTAVTIVREAAARAAARRAEVFGAGGYTAPSGEEITGEASPGPVRTKSTPTDPVTVVDTETEDFVRARLGELRPGEAILGEEQGATERPAPGAVRWVVDPIDGTVNFMYGVPAYAVSLAAQIDGVSVAGAVADIASGALYSASRGGGAREIAPDGAVRDLRVNSLDDPGLALVATGFGYHPERRARQGAILAQLLPRVRDVRRIGSAALDLCMVAAGRVDAHYEHGLSPWDWAAGALIADEAGARVVLPGPDSTSADGELTLVAVPGVADAFAQLLRAAGGYEALPQT
ncbi:inositol monophosphatase family protein [Tsukamurella sp. 8F]|uniref:inositol monophosphatase family protein n=1 Tax=unclassified Tsukamurella TaxID=2633480 RepID=UPI0023B9A4CE|nr:MULTISPECIES: inositol monophosphatase family protein [unclassified Tsukamurella]MDF0531299.1 inositol monophosphatase family protein [Tsukamurella sp. 8J]MDF0585248.1 inositol monophosphatase family protein [Tsukamurella sp. 8F]